MGRESDSKRSAGADPGETEASDPAGRSAVERHLSPFFSDSTLWPVLAAASGIFATLGAALILLAFWERNPFAALALLLLAGVSVDVAYRDLSRRRFGLASRAVAALWILSGAVAGVVVRLGIF